MVSVKPNEVEGVGLQEGSILRCMNVLWWDAMDGPSNIGEKGDDGRGLPNTFSKVEVVTYNGADCRFVCRREAILREANAKVCLGKLMRVRTIEGSRLGVLDEVKCYMVVYAPYVIALRLELWVNLLELTRAARIPGCLRGDFNDVKMVVECRGCVDDSGGMADFVSFINDGGFVDFPASGKLLMWFGSGSKGCRLDRFLLSAEWVDKFGGWNNITFHVTSQIMRRSVCLVV
ncbi:hypothetical protein V6N13_037828 [Hibiscus sabdariffa]